MFLIVTRNFPPDIGGIQSLMGGLSRNLLNHGPVKVFANHFPNSNIYDTKSQMNIERVKGIKLFSKYRKAILVNNFLKESNNIRAVLADHWKSLELLNKEYLNKSKTICLIHSKEINSEVGTSLNKRLIKSIAKADFVVANSHFTKELAIKVGINSSKIKVIYPGIEKPVPVEDKFNIQAEQIYKDSFPKIITVARLDKRKGHEKILMNIRNLKNKFPKIKYISIGTGEEEDSLNKLTKELKLENEVVFFSRLEEKLKNALIANSNLFLMPTIIYKKSVEGFGISYIEAASYGIASIGGKDGGASDAIKHNETGLICNGNDIGSIYESINIFFHNNKFIEFGKAAKEFSQNFYWNKTVKKYLELIG